MIDYRIGDYVGAMEGKDGGEPTFGRIESTGFTPEDEIYIRTADGELTGPWMIGDDTVWKDPSYHVDYPHHPGTLHDCPACEASGSLDSVSESSTTSTELDRD